MTSLTYQILLALADADRHGYGIIKEIDERFGVGSAPSTGALYLALQRMENDGLIGEAEPSADGSGGPQRRYYRLSRAGRSAVMAESVRLADLVSLARHKNLLPGNADA